MYREVNITSIKDGCLSSRYNAHKFASLELTSIRYILTLFHFVKNSRFPSIFGEECDVISLKIILNKLFINYLCLIIITYKNSVINEINVF